MKKQNNIVLIVALCGMMGASIGIAMNSLGVFYQPVSEALNVGRGTFALYTTFSSLSIAIAQLFLPNLYNGKNFKKILLGSTIVAAGSLMAMSLANALWQFYLLAVLMGVANSLFNIVVITTILNTSFTENVGTYTGIVLSFSGLVGAVLSPLISNIIQKFSWQAGYLAVGASMILFNLPALLSPITYKKVESKNGSSKGNGLSGNAMPFVLVCVMVALLNLCVGMSQHLSGFALTRGVAAESASLLVSGMMIGNIVFKVAGGTLSDKIGTAKTAYLLAGIALVGILLLITQKSVVLLIAGSFFFGALYSINTVLQASYIRSFYGMENYTSLYAIGNFIASGVFALALSGIGYVYDFAGSYQPYLVAILLMIVIIIGIITVLGNMERNLKRK